MPLVKDFHSRGFWRDPRLRADEVEFVVRRYEQSPAVQLVRWFAIRKGRKYELDYWCDICAIPMYELKTCDCCQGEIRLRERLSKQMPRRPVRRPGSGLSRFSLVRAGMARYM